MEGWIGLDAVEHAALPVWARPAARPRSPSVVLDDEGIALVERDVGSVARWSEVFGVVVVGEAAFVLVPRRPPNPPWFEVRLEMVSPDAARDGLEALAARLRERASRRGYRDAPLPRESLPLDELRSRLLARDPVPGTLEIRFGKEHVRTGLDKVKHLAFTGFGGSVVGGFIVMVGLPVLVPAGSAAMLGVVGGFTALGTALGWIENSVRRGQAGPRVLALSPDGCVAGLFGGVRAFAWSEIACFETSTVRHPRGYDEPSLRIAGRDGELANVPERFYGLPIDLVAACAESYRKRATAG